MVCTQELLLIDWLNSVSLLFSQDLDERRCQVTSLEIYLHKELLSHGTIKEQCFLTKRPMLQILLRSLKRLPPQ